MAGMIVEVQMEAKIVRKNVQKWHMPSRPAAIMQLPGHAVRLKVVLRGKNGCDANSAGNQHGVLRRSIQGEMVSRALILTTLETLRASNMYCDALWPVSSRLGTDVAHLYIRCRF